MNYLSIIINSIGLIFDIIGTILLFMYGLPSNIDKDGNEHLITGVCNKEEKLKAQRYDFWGKIGLILLIIGFIFQFISNFI